MRETLFAKAGKVIFARGTELLAGTGEIKTAIMLRAYSRVGRNINVVNKNRIFARDKEAGRRGVPARRGLCVCYDGTAMSYVG